MTPIDLTSELAPLIWTMEALTLFAVAWLIGMFLTEQMRSGHFRQPEVRNAKAPEPTVPDFSEEITPADNGRMAA